MWMYVSARWVYKRSPLNFKELVDNCSLRKYNHPQVPEKEHFTFNEGNYLQIYFLHWDYMQIIDANYHSITQTT